MKPSPSGRGPTFLKGLASSLSGFAAATAITGLATALSIPVLISVAGATTWAVVAVGQAVGAVGSVIVGFGWALSGTAMVAVLPDSDRSALLARSIISRSIIAIPAVAVTAFVALMLVPQDAALAMLTAGAYCLLGLSAGWYFVGTRQPGQYLLKEVLPRTATSLLGLLLASQLHQVTAYPASIAIGAVISVLITLRGTKLKRGEASLIMKQFPADLKAQTPMAISGLASTLYLNLPLLAVTTLAPHDLVSFAFADKCFKLANAAINPVVSVLQGRIPHAEEAVLLRRIRVGLKATGIVAVGAVVTFAVGVTAFAPLLGIGQIKPDLPTILIFAVILGATVTSQVTGFACLASLGRASIVARSAVLGAVCGVPILLLGTLVAGGRGAAGGELIAEVGVVVYQLAHLHMEVRTRRTRRASPE